MARKPKTAPSNVPEPSVEAPPPTLTDAAPPARRGRKPKAAEMSEPAPVGGNEAAASPSLPTMDTPPARGRPGQKPKGRGKAAAPSLLQEALEQQPEPDMGQPDPAAAGDDAMIAEMAYPVSSDDGSTAAAADAAPSSPVQGTPSAEPAAQWDRATDTVRFDWAKIERTASQDGPNQAMAKLLVAARAEGANSRWPL